MLVVLLTLVISSCVTMGPSFVEHISPADKATLYIYRSSTIVGIADPDYPTLFINDIEASKLKIGGYTAVSLESGNYDINIMKSLLGIGPQNNEVARLNMDLSQGETVYLKFKIDAFIGKVIFGFQVMDETNGKAQVSKTKLRPLINDVFEPK